MLSRFGKSISSNNESYTVARQRRFFALILLMWLMLFSATAIAQEVTGAIQGQVRDAAGAVISGATVTVQSDQRGFSQTTNENGRYRFISLLPGIYAVTASATGFSAVRVENIAVELGRTLQVTLSLNAGIVREAVTVSAADQPIVDVTSSKTTVNITRGTIDLLPKGLTFTSILNFAPGTRAEGRAGGFQIDGSSGSENAFIVDGVETTHIRTGAMDGTKNVHLDFVKEVQVKSGAYEAEHGGATGGVVNVATRSGSNEFHGEARAEYTSDTFRTGNRPSLRLNPLDFTQQTIEYFTIPNESTESVFLNPIISIGGPVIRNKMWFFAGMAPQYSRSTVVTDLIKPIARGDTEIRVLDSRFLNSRARTDYYIGRLDYSPTDRLSLYGNFISSPRKIEGSTLGIQTSSPTAFYNDRYPYQGGFVPSWQTAFGAFWTVTPQLILSFRGGHSYVNEKGGSYDIPVNTPQPVISVPCPAGKFDCGEGTTTTGLPTIRTNFLTEYDILRRTNLNFDFTYNARLLGEHSFKGGYQTNLVSNKLLAGSSGGQFNFYFDRSFLGQRGAYGYYLTQDYREKGDVSSSNQGFYFQDGWRIHNRVTLNLGLRFEKEYLPSYQINRDGHPDLPPDLELSTRPIEFGWTDKIAPRLGGAWDIFGNGRLKLSGSFSIFYDTMKYEMPRLSFGGQTYLATWRKLEHPDFRGISLQNQPGDIIFGPVDYRFPTNVNLPGQRPGIDPDLMPFRMREYSAQVEYSFLNDFVLSARFIRKKVGRTIEDVGGADENGNEVYTIGNPGFGATTDFFNPPTPKAVREYNGLEVRLDKRFSRNWFTSVAYVFSRLYGNYSGLASSDENGRTSPNVERYFDLPELIYDTHGREILGRLATDRPNTFRAYAAYNLSYGVFGRKMETMIGGSQSILQGAPISTYLAERTGVAGDFVYPEGRGDIGRAPTLTSTDLTVNHYISLTERVRFRFTINVFNLFDQKTPLGIYPYYLASGQVVRYADFNEYINSSGDWRERVAQQKLITSPMYNKVTGFHGPRSMRLAVGLTF